jgi:hypothetical protein
MNLGQEEGKRELVTAQKTSDNDLKCKMSFGSRSKRREDMKRGCRE